MRGKHPAYTADLWCYCTALASRAVNLAQAARFVTLVHVGRTVALLNLVTDRPFDSALVRFIQSLFKADPAR